MSASRAMSPAAVSSRDLPSPAGASSTITQPSPARTSASRCSSRVNSSSRSTRTPRSPRPRPLRRNCTRPCTGGSRSTIYPSLGRAKRHSDEVLGGLRPARAPHGVTAPNTTLALDASGECDRRRAGGREGLEISGLAYDARQVAPGALFFCVPGFTRDGHDFAVDAVARGAVALVVERPLNLEVPEIQVPSARAAMAPAAAAFYGDPDRPARAGRCHGHQRQDDDGVPDPLAPRGGRPADGPAGDRDQRDRRGGASGGAHDA